MRRDIKDERSFYVSRLPIDEERQMNPVFATARHISQDIKLSLRLEDTVYHIGSQLMGTIALQNNSKRKIRGIDVQLLHQEYARCRGKSRMFSSRDRVKETSHKTSVLRIPVPEENTREFRIDFAMKIPSSAEETGSWNLFHLDAIVKASLDLAWAKDVSCSHKIKIVSAL
jgi:hypothetical protein